MKSANMYWDRSNANLSLRKQLVVVADNIDLELDKVLVEDIADKVDNFEDMAADNAFGPKTTIN